MDLDCNLPIVLGIADLVALVYCLCHKRKAKWAFSGSARQDGAVCCSAVCAPVELEIKGEKQRWQQQRSSAPLLLPVQANTIPLKYVDHDTCSLVRRAGLKRVWKVGGERFTHAVARQNVGNQLLNL